MRIVKATEVVQGDLVFLVSWNPMKPPNRYKFYKVLKKKDIVRPRYRYVEMQLQGSYKSKSGSYTFGDYERFYVIGKDELGEFGVVENKGMPLKVEAEELRKTLEEVSGKLDKLLEGWEEVYGGRVKEIRLADLRDGDIIMVNGVPRKVTMDMVAYHIEGENHINLRSRDEKVDIWEKAVDEY